MLRGRFGLLHRLAASAVVVVAVLLLVVVPSSSASYLGDLSRYWRSLEERLLSGVDSDDIFDDALFGDGAQCRGFSACLRSSGVDFIEVADHRCSNLTKLFNCYSKVRTDCARKQNSGWQHVFATDTTETISLPLPSLRRFDLECESGHSLQSQLQDMKRHTSSLEAECSSDDPLRKYFATGSVNSEFVYDAPKELSPDADDTPMRLTCRFFLSAVNEGYFSYRLDKSGPNACYPVILHRTCTVLDMASRDFVRHCKTLLGSATPQTFASPIATVTPSYFPDSCAQLMQSPSTQELAGFRTSNNRRFVGFVREDAVFPVRSRLAFSPADEAALPPEKCTLSELGWITLIANQFYKISGLVKKNGTQGYLVEVEVQLFREPPSTVATAQTTSTGSSKVITVITVPQVQHSAQTGGLHDLAGHGTMRLRNINGVGTLALIRLYNSRTNCALLRYSGLDRYHLRCRMPYELVSRSFGLLVDGCESPRPQDSKPQEREGDVLLEKLLQYDLTLVTDALFDLEKDSGFWAPKRITPSASSGQSAASSSSATSSHCRIETAALPAVALLILTAATLKLQLHAPTH